jgi:hypothetical protein
MKGTLSRATGRSGPARVPYPRAPWPSVGVVIATRARPNLLRRALDSVLIQNYPGPMRVVVVYDDAAPDWRIARGGTRPVLVLENWRSPGFAGARNSGILAVGDCDLVALCTDDDTWAVPKLTWQVSAMRAQPGALAATCASEVEYGGRLTPRRVGQRQLDLDLLGRHHTRVPRLSGLVARQAALADGAAGGVGLLDEDAPADCGHWDLLVRTASQAPVVHVDEPLVRVLWRRHETGPDRFWGQIHMLRWMGQRHPEIFDPPRAAAQLHAELAGWEAAAGWRSDAWASARAALRNRWYSASAVRALAAAAGVLRGRRLVSALHRGRLP